MAVRSGASGPAGMLRAYLLLLLLLLLWLLMRLLLWLLLLHGESFHQTELLIRLQDKQSEGAEAAESPAS